MNGLALACAGALLATASAATSAATITQWNFNSATPDNATSTGLNTPSIGSGTLSLIGGVTSPSFNSGVGSSDPAASDNSGFQTTTYAAQGAGNKTRGVNFNVSTVGFSNVAIAYDLRHSNTSARHEQVQYSIDGTTFVDVAAFSGATGDTWFNNRTVDLSAIAGVANNANFAFRVVAMFAPSTSAYQASSSTSTYGGAGTWRFDMATVSGAPVPVPAALPLLASALGLIAVRRRRTA